MSPFLQQVITFLTTDPGNQVYHLVLTQLICGALLAAIYLWRSGEPGHVGRLVAGLALLLGLRLALFVVSAL